MAKTSGGGVAAFFFFVLLTEICVSGFFLPNDFIRRNAELEWTWVNRSLGESTNREITALAAALFLRVLYGGALSPLVRLLASAGVMALAYAFFRDYALGFTNLFKGGETIFDLFGA